MVILGLALVSPGLAPIEPRLGLGFGLRLGLGHPWLSLFSLGLALGLTRGGTLSPALGWDVVLHICG